MDRGADLVRSVRRARQGSPSVLPEGSAAAENLQIASRIVAGELSGRRGKWDDAIRSVQEAVSLEDAIPYNEPPVWHHPPRQVLGALLLEAGRPADAERVYRKDLERFRENGWSLFGLMKSLEAQGAPSPLLPDPSLSG